MNLGAVGVGGGTIIATAVYDYSTIPNDPSYPSTSSFNFHGGTLKASHDSPWTDVPNFMEQIKHVYVYGEGAIIDSNGHNISIGPALEAPTGKGVLEIPVVDGGAGALSVIGASTSLTATSIRVDTLTIAGTTGVASAAVPEPSTLVLLGLGVLGLLAGSWRRRR